VIHNGESPTATRYARPLAGGRCADFKGNLPNRMVYSEYNVAFDVTAPPNAIDTPPGS